MSVNVLLRVLNRKKVTAFNIHLRYISRCDIQSVQKSPPNDSVITYDVLDDFTDRLTQQKAFKWNSIIDSRNKLYAFVDISSDINISFEKLSEGEFEKRMLQLIDNNNLKAINDVVQYCQESRRTIPYDTLLKFLSMYSQAGDKYGVITLLDIGCETYVLDSCKLQHCQQYLAESTWIQGNVSEAISIFKDLYQSYPSLRYKIGSLVEQLILSTTMTHTEAILVQITKFVRELSEEHNDTRPLIALWQVCFLSEWFSDQQTAIQLLNDSENLRKSLSNRYNVLSAVALKRNKIEVVQRLFEVFLKHDMKEHYVQLLQLLFDFNCWRRDFRHCAEIIHWSATLQIPLRQEQHERYLKLFIQQYSLPGPGKFISPQPFKYKF